MGVLDLLRDAMPGVAAARVGYQRGQQERADRAETAEQRRLTALRQKMQDERDAEWHRLRMQTGQAALEPKPPTITDSGVLNPLDGTVEDVYSDGTRKVVRKAAPTELRKAMHIPRAPRDPDAPTPAQRRAEEEEEQLGLSVLGQTAPNRDIAIRFQRAYQNIRRQYPDLKPGIVAHRAAQASGYFTASGTLQRPPAPPKTEDVDDTEAAIADAVAKIGGAPSTVRPTGPAPADSTSGGAPTVPLQQRVQQLKASGLSKEEARRKLLAEGYDLGGA